MSKRRIELKFWDSGGVVALLVRYQAGRSASEIHELLVNDEDRLINEGYYLSPGLYQDDEFILRVVQGELNAKEKAEWVARFDGKLDLSADGELILCSAYDWFGYSDWVSHLYSALLPGKHGGMYETTTLLRLPPGLYQASIYSYLPADLSDSWDGEDEGGEYISGVDAKAKYFEQTRPDEDPPDWITGDDDEQEYIAFVLHLQPVDKASFDALQVDTEWQRRHPAKCPLGIITETEFEDEESYSNFD